MILLFDLDNTLTQPGKNIEYEHLKRLEYLSKTYTLGIVSSSNFERITNQIPNLDIFKYIFAENGTTSYYYGKQFHQTTFSKFVGEYKFTKIINVILEALSHIEIPIKRGQFIEYRNGLLSVSPIGRQCSQEEREMFIEYESTHNVRKSIIEYIKPRLQDYNLMYTIGGKISFEIMPHGWDKTYCLQFLKDEGDIIFFGDMTHEYGNDYTLSKAVKTYTVSSPSHAFKILDDEFITRN